MSTTTELFWEHVEDIKLRAFAGDEDASRTLACLGLLATGWMPGDPDPDGDDGGPDGGETIIPSGNVIDFQAWRLAS
jgi:hypothetical protein